MAINVCFRKLTIIACVLIYPICSALRVLVTSDLCGKTLNLTVVNELRLHYEGADIGDLFTRCVINVANEDSSRTLCIESESRNYFDYDCFMGLRYFTGGVGKFSSYSKGYTCKDFYMDPLCTRERVSSVEYTGYTRHQNLSIHVRFFTQKYVATTTKRYTTTTWSSSYDDDDNDVNDDMEATWSVVGTMIGVFFILMAICCCVCAKVRKRPSPKPEYHTPAVQYHAQTTNGNQYANQTQNFQNEAAGSQQNIPNYSGYHQQQQYGLSPSAYAGYQVHSPVCQNITNEDAVNGNQPNVIHLTDPPPYEDQPPPYPGY